MLTILVGDVRRSATVDLEAQVAWSAMLPSKLVTAFAEYISGCDAGAHIIVRVYTDTIINWVGEQIEDGKINHNQVQIMTDAGIHFYTQDGVIDETWPHGIFNY